jgi:hypothetical protein
LRSGFLFHKIKLAFPCEVECRSYRICRNCVNIFLIFSRNLCSREGRSLEARSLLLFVINDAANERITRIKRMIRRSKISRHVTMLLPFGARGTSPPTGGHAKMRRKNAASAHLPLSRELFLTREIALSHATASQARKDTKFQRRSLADLRKKNFVPFACSRRLRSFLVVFPPCTGRPEKRCGDASHS